MRTSKRGALIVSIGLVVFALGQGPEDHIGLLPGHSSVSAAEDSQLPVTMAYTLTNTMASNVIVLNPSSLQFVAQPGGPLPTAMSFVLSTTTASLTISWSVTDDALWLDESPASGVSASRVITVQTNTTGMSAGQYQATILVHSPDAINSPQSCLVTYTLANCLVLQTGDVNFSGDITASDVIYVVNHVFRSGPAPQLCPAAGDVNCSGNITSADVIYMVNHVFKSDAPPCNLCQATGLGWTCP